MRNLVLFPISLLLGFQSGPSAAQIRIEPPAARTADSWIARYVQDKEQETEALRAAGLGPDWSVIAQRVARYLPPQSYPSDSANGQAALRAAHIRSTANFMVKAGYRARHLRNPVQARTLVRAANIVSWHDAEALVLTSPIVFVAELKRIDRKSDNSADLVYAVREPIKSAPARGTELRHPLNGAFAIASSRPGTPAPPPPPNPAASELASYRFVLFLMKPADGSGSPFPLFSPMPIVGNEVHPGYHADTAETTLTAVRATARAQLCSPGYAPVVAGVDLPHRC